MISACATGEIRGQQGSEVKQSNNVGLLKWLLLCGVNEFYSHTARSPRELSCTKANGVKERNVSRAFTTVQAIAKASPCMASRKPRA